MPAAWSIVGTCLLIVAAVVIGGLAVYALRRRRLSASPADKPSETPDRLHSCNDAAGSVTYNVELSKPADQDQSAFTEFVLSCPHCGFSGPMDDLSLVGESVDCPLCEESFLILEPEYA